MNITNLRPNSASATTTSLNTQSLKNTMGINTDSIPNPLSLNNTNVDTNTDTGTDTGTDTDTDTDTDTSKPFKNTSLTFKILFVVTILGLIGINLFGYAGIIIDKVNDITGPIIRKLVTLLGFYTTETVKTTVSTAAEGTKLVADTTKNITTSVIDTTQEETAKLRNELEASDAGIVAPIVNKDIIPEVQKRKEKKLSLIMMVVLLPTSKQVVLKVGVILVKTMV